MGIGHAAVALGAARVAPRVNVGLLIFAAFLADFLLGVFAFLGLEQAHVPADYASRHYLTFTFPYSHGLVFLLLWGVLLGALLCWVDRQRRVQAFLVIAALVLSHFVLDGLVHVPELPLAGPNSFKVGWACGTTCRSNSPWKPSWPLLGWQFTGNWREMRRSTAGGLHYSLCC
jgi:hypothetical protein